MVTNGANKTTGMEEKIGTGDKVARMATHRARARTTTGALATTRTTRDPDLAEPTESTSNADPIESTATAVTVNEGEHLW